MFFFCGIYNGFGTENRWALIWWLWAVLWGNAFVTDIMKKKTGRFVPVLQIIEGVVTAWIPGILILLGLW